MYKAIAILILFIFSSCRASQFIRLNTNIHKKDFEDCAYILDMIRDNVFYNKKYNYYVSAGISDGSEEHYPCIRKLTKEDILKIYGKPHFIVENQFHYLTYAEPYFDFPNIYMVYDHIIAFEDNHAMYFGSDAVYQAKGTPAIENFFKNLNKKYK
jgi:hypothetical protein